MSHLNFKNNFQKILDVNSLAIKEAKIDYIPIITVAIPTYKRSITLKDAIDSALNQIDYFDFDIIIVDNEPERDTHTELLISKYSDNRISYYKNSKNLGMAGNWNRCFELAKGDYVVLLHDDDILLPNFLSQSIKVIGKLKNVGIFKPRAYTLQLYDKWDHLKQPILSRNQWVQRIYDFSNFNEFVLGAPTGCFFYKDYVKEIGGFNQDYYPYLDFKFTLDFTQLFPVYIYSEKLSIYRIGINDTLNISTLIKSFEGVYVLRKELFSKYNVPNVIQNWFVRNNMTGSFQGYKISNYSFSYELLNIEFRPTNKFNLFIYYYLSNLLSKLLILFTRENLK